VVPTRRCPRPIWVMSKPGSHQRAVALVRAGGAKLPTIGTPDQAIAGQSVITVDRAKRQVSHLLGKLTAADRGEAVTRARQLRLIPSRYSRAGGGLGQRFRRKSRSTRITTALGAAS
jgi:hypothetical protein